MQKKNSWLSDEKKDFITNFSEDIANFYFPKQELVTPSLITDNYGITWSKGDYEDAFDGLLEFYHGSFHIYLNESRHQNKSRMRFTFSHELGHFFIDGHRNALASGEAPAHSSFTNFTSDNIIEREADFFAASLLMPRDWVLQEYRKYRKFSFDIISSLSTNFRVSLTATIFRVFYLDLHPMMIVKAQNGEICRIQTSRDFYFYPKHKKNKIPEDSIMYQYFYERKKHKNTQQIWSGDWFNTSSEVKMYEHCIYYDLYNTCYSLVWMN